MNFDDIQKTWNEQPVPPPGDPSAEAALLVRICKDTARFEHRSRHTDFMIIFVYGLASLAYIGIAYMDGRPVRALSAVLLLPVALYVILFRIKNRLPAVGPDASLKDALAHALASLRRRRLFLPNFFWAWWLLLCVSRIIAGIDAHMHDPSSDQTMHSLQEASVFLFLGLAGFFGNRTHIKTKIDPQIAELEEQQRTLLSTEEPAA